MIIEIRFDKELLIAREIQAFEQHMLGDEEKHHIEFQHKDGDWETKYLKDFIHCILIYGDGKHQTLKGYKKMKHTFNSHANILRRKLN